MATSYANRTAPVLRGAWILENILGTPPAAPPPDVEAFKENKDGEKALSVREIMEQHRAKPSCNACHGVMDPLGFALENFDAIGEWRAKDRYAGDGDRRVRHSSWTARRSAARPICARRSSSDPEQFVQTMTEKLMTYALGRSVEYYDMPAVRAIVRDAARDNYRFSSIVMGIVQKRAVPDAEGAGQTALDGTLRAVAVDRRSRMFITKKHLSRRTFLRGAGVAVGLPLLDAMVPAWTALAQTAASPKPRMGFMYLPHGAIMEQWTPAADGAELRADADPQAARAVPEAADDRERAGEQAGAIAPPVHALNPGTWLSCVTPQEGAGAATAA